MTLFQPMVDVSVQSEFEGFRQELDDHQSRRERIIKVSRDITACSKRLIFLLHRISQKEAEAINTEIEPKAEEIYKLMRQVSPELQEENFWRYHRSIAPGLEEYIEAASFAHYVSTGQKTQEVFPFSQAQSAVVACGIPQISYLDFLGGIADLTGELMRLGVDQYREHDGGGTKCQRCGCTGKGGKIDTNEQVHREDPHSESAANALKALDPMIPKLPYMSSKLRTMDASLRKLEDTSYTIGLRGKEYSEYPAALRDLVGMTKEQPRPEALGDS